jgi:hypothetical protein
MDKSQRRAAARRARATAAALMQSVPPEDQQDFADVLADEQDERDNGADIARRELNDGAAAYDQYRRETIEGLAEQWADHPEVAVMARSAITSGLSVSHFKNEVLQMFGQRTRPIETGRLEVQAYDSQPRERCSTMPR